MIEDPQAKSKRLAQLAATLRGRSYLLTRSILPAMQEAIDEVLQHDHFDLVLCESVMLAGYRLPADLPLVIDQHNLEFEICWRTYQREKVGLRKLYSWLEARRLQPEELRRCQIAAQVLVTSEREQQTLLQHLPESNVGVIPNGVDTMYFRAANPSREVAQRLIFTGSMDYYPNTDAALFFARECWPEICAQLPDASWYIVEKTRQHLSASWLSYQV